MKSRLAIYGKVLVALWMVVTLHACSDDTAVFEEYRPSDVICFTASLSADAQAVQSRGGVPYLDIVEEEWELEGTSTEDSRGAIRSSLNGLEVGVIGSVYSSEGVFSTFIMNNHKFKFANKEELKSSSTPVLWKNVGDNNKLRVYSYAPYVETTNAGNFSFTTVNNEPAVTYTVPDDVDTQTDIIASDMKEVPGDYKQYIPLTYNHILTGIRFKAGFACTVKKIEIKNINGKGTYALSGAWSGQTGKNGTSGTDTYVIEFDEGKSCTTGTMITDENSIFMMIPQQLPETAQVVLTYDSDKTVTASLKDLKWEPGKLITYTINKESSSSDKEIVYFDLHAGNVSITPTSYSGYVYVNGTAVKVTSGTDAINTSTKKFYVYQSTYANKNSTGWENTLNEGTCRIPQYDPVMVGNRFWSDYITNNNNVENVIETWDTSDGLKADEDNSSTSELTGAVRAVGRSSSPYFIAVTGDGTNVVDCDLTIDNIYSRYQVESQSRITGGISFVPKKTKSTLNVRLVGDNRLGNIHYYSASTGDDMSKLVLQGTGSLTVADVDFSIKNGGYYSNHYNSVIGGNDHNYETSHGIVIESGVIFAGSTKAENCSAIGGGGNGDGTVIIEGGSVTAVATTTGTAIGGGIGFSSPGGKGNVTISGGNVYAYNLANPHNDGKGIPSAAIGGAGSSAQYGEEGNVTISDGYVYAETAQGTAIGGGSSATKQGGAAIVTITGGYVIAKSIPANGQPAGAGIGGGTGGTENAVQEGQTTPAYGGSATIRISGNPIIRTGSIGGGKTNNTNGHIGYADIEVKGGDICAQFVMAAGAGQKSIFKMEGGTISNSDVDDKEYFHIVKNGGAVYMEDGEFTLSGDGKILNCTGQTGGAVYIKKSDNALNPPTFTMSGGLIENCSSKTHGGAVYLEGGEVTISEGIIQGNLAKQGHGGAVYIKEGNFKMPENGNAEIKGNVALRRGGNDAGNGGGIYVTSASSDVIVEVFSGEIDSNSCDGNGGGICVDMSANDSNTANVTIGADGSTDEKNPSIEENWAVMYGGGLYAIGAKANVVINGGQIFNNHVPNYVPNMDVANEGGTVTLNGGNVTHQTITFKANADDATVDGESEVYQKIVTNTNSFLKLPSEPQRNLYRFVGWNRRPDGLDPDNFTDGQIMNIKEDITLYAIWEAQ